MSWAALRVRSLGLTTEVHRLPPWASSQVTMWAGLAPPGSEGGSPVRGGLCALNPHPRCLLCLLGAPEGGLGALPRPSHLPGVAVRAPSSPLGGSHRHVCHHRGPVGWCWAGAPVVWLLWSLCPLLCESPRQQGVKCGSWGLILFLRSHRDAPGPAWLAAVLGGRADPAAAGGCDSLCSGSSPVKWVSCRKLRPAAPGLLLLLLAQRHCRGPPRQLRGGPSCSPLVLCLSKLQAPQSTAAPRSRSAAPGLARCAPAPSSSCSSSTVRAAAAGRDSCVTSPTHTATSQGSRPPPALSCVHPVPSSGRPAPPTVMATHRLLRGCRWVRASLLPCRLPRPSVPTALRCHFIHRLHVCLGCLARHGGRDRMDWSRPCSRGVLFTPPPGEDFSPCPWGSRNRESCVGCAQRRASEVIVRT